MVKNCEVMKSYISPADFNHNFKIHCIFEIQCIFKNTMYFFEIQCIFLKTNVLRNKNIVLVLKFRYLYDLVLKSRYFYLVFCTLDFYFLKLGK